MTILVTGGMGFIGHHVVAALQALNRTTMIVDSCTNYDVIDRNELDQLLFSRAERINASHFSNIDILDTRQMYKLFEENTIDTVIYLAGYPNQKMLSKNVINARQVMIDGLENVLHFSLNTGVKRFVYISSSMVYGSWTGDIAETAACNPENQYGMLKLAGEMLVKSYCYNTDMKYTIIRPSAVYGARDNSHRVIYKFLLAAMNDKTLMVNGPDELLDFTHVDDLAAGIIRASTNPLAENRVFNLSRSKSRTLLEAAQLAVDTVGAGKIEVCDKDKVFPSRDRLNTYEAFVTLGFNPTIDLETGINKCYGFLRNSPFWASKTIR